MSSTVLMTTCEIPYCCHPGLDPGSIEYLLLHRSKKYLCMDSAVKPRNDKIEYSAALRKKHKKWIAMTSSRPSPYQPPTSLQKTHIQNATQEV